MAHRGVLLLLVLLSGCRPTAESAGAPSEWRQKDIDRLVELIEFRLDLMESVARWKRDQNRPIEDPDREQALLGSLRAGAEKRGLAVAPVERFFEAQFAAAKKVQRFWFAKWEDDPPASKDAVADLVTEIRPKLSKLSERMLDALVECAPFAEEADWQAAVRQRTEVRLNAEYVTEAMRRDLLVPLWEIRVNK